MSLSYILRFFAHYKYFAIFPIAVAEGPIITIICGFLISRGTLAFIPVFLVVFLGDVISDSIFYFLGRKGRQFIQKLKFLRITDERMTRIEKRYEQSPWKTMIVAKVSYGLGILFMTASGMAKMSYKKFFYFMALLNAVRSLVLIGIGYYFGRIAIHFGPTYISYYTLAVLIVVPCGYFILRRIKKSHS